jgi:hypothetical protein
MINPDSFKFRRVQENWQETRCTEIRFAYGSAFMAPMVIRVGVVVGAPITLSNGRQLTSREAQLDSANAAQAAATLIIALLDEGAIIPSEIQPRFTGLMGGAMLANGLGYRVTGCFPG